MTPEAMLFFLLAGHALADYPLQGDFLARFKNAWEPSSEAVLGSRHGWVWILASHAGIHGGVVAFLTGSLILGTAEMVLHFLIDHAKCAGLISFDMDQTLHLVCKVVWVMIGFLVWGVG